MKTGLIITCAALLIGTTVAGKLITTNNTFVDWERDIVKFDKESQNTLANYTTKIFEVTQVPKMYEKSLRNVIKDTFSGRYGADGSKATMQWIQENNIQFDSTMFTKIQTTMEAGRNEFRLSQTKKIEVCENYRAELNYVVGGFVAGLLGFPKADLDQVCTIVLNDHTNEAFKTKIDNGVKLDF